MELIKTAPFQIKEIQTDNGTEFTKALISKKAEKTMFEKVLELFDIKYHRIRVATPRHNGKVERQNRKRFYENMRMYKFGRRQKTISRLSKKIK